MATPAGRSLVLPTIAAFVGFTILASLGVWQLQRLQWKEALIARVEGGLDAPPVAAPGPDEWPDIDLGELEYQPVSVTGRFRNDAEVHVVTTLTSPKGPLGGVGYLVMTPLDTAEGWTVYVNRGFVPKANKDADSRNGGLIEDATTVTGLLRAPHRRSWFMPGDGIADNEWFSRHPKLYAETYGLRPDRVAPYIIDAKFDATLPGGLPQGGETIVNFPNSHLGYALTWFGLAAGLAGVFAVFARGRLRK